MESRRASSRERFAALELVGEQELLLAQLEEIARAGQEFVVIDRALQEVGRARLERAQAKAALLVDRDDDGRNLGGAGQFAEPADESAPSMCGILKSVTTRSGVLSFTQSSAVTGSPKLRTVMPSSIEDGEP